MFSVIFVVQFSSVLVSDGCIRPNLKSVSRRLSFYLCALVSLTLRVCGFHLDVDCECYSYVVECLPVDTEGKCVYLPWGPTVSMCTAMEEL